MQEADSVVVAAHETGCAGAPDTAAQGGDGIGHEPGVRHELLLRTAASWDSTPYRAYPSGPPELCIEKITIAPHTVLRWHTHLAPIAVYVLQGEIMVEKRGSLKQLKVKAGQVFSEMVGPVHRGIVRGEEPVVLIAFHASSPGMPLARTVPREAH